MNPSDYSDILLLCDSLYENHSTSLQLKANAILETKIGAESSIFLSLSDDQSKVSCQVLGDKVLEEEICFRIENSCLEPLVKKQSHILCNDINDGCSVISKYLCITVQSVLCVPIFHPRQKIMIFFLCLFNKKRFTAEDLDTVNNWSKCISPLLFRCQAFEEERRIRKNAQSLLLVVKNLLIQIDDITLLLNEIMIEAKKLTQAERCSLFLLDKEKRALVAKVFDSSLKGVEQYDPDILQMSVDEGIAGYVAKTGGLLNVSDAYSHPLFCRKIDELTGYKTRNILCFAIKDDKGIVGVAQLCNKINGQCFTRFDEELATSFSVYCAISLMHSLTWKRIAIENRRSQISNELIMQVKISEEDVSSIYNAGFRPLESFHEDFCKFNFLPRSVPDSETLLAVKNMFDDLGMIKRWEISEKVLSRFLVAVKQGYRDQPYHNWMHAFSVGHFAFLLLKNLKLMGNQLTELEGLSLFVACLCHDLDHRGTTNSFQISSKTNIATMYSSEGSVMERHHFAQTMAILQTEGCNIFENLTDRDYTQCLDHVRNVILATDLAHYFRILADIEKMQNEGYNKSNPEHHYLLMCLIVTSCDLSDQTKDWKNTKEISTLIYEEFFYQGDLEILMGVKPCEMMDRRKADIPGLQINFIKDIVSPLYHFLVNFFPEMMEVAQNVDKHKDQWEKVQAVFKEYYNGEISPFDFLNDERVEAAAASV